jgi:hypothetical protein
VRDVDEQIATGTLPATPEEELARDWEVEDALARVAQELGITGAWTAFSPAECRMFAAALDVTGFAAAITGVEFSMVDGVVVEQLRLKAVAGGAR